MCRIKWRVLQDLRKVHPDTIDMLIIEDTFTFRHHPHNGVLVNPFFGVMSKYDTVLRDLLSVLHLWHNGTLRTPAQVVHSYTDVEIQRFNKRLEMNYDDDTDDVDDELCKDDDDDYGFNLFDFDDDDGLPIESASLSANDDKRDCIEF